NADNPHTYIELFPDISAQGASKLAGSRIIADERGLRVAYLPIDSFDHEGLCTNENGPLVIQIKELLKNGAQAFILDLRKNMGGSLAEGNCTAGLFLPQKSLIFLTTDL